MAEYRISIYGRKMSEWDQLASWIVNNDLYSENVVWLIQVGYLFDAFVLYILSSTLCVLTELYLHRFMSVCSLASTPVQHLQGHGYCDIVPEYP